MIAEGRELAKIDEHVVVKVPFTREGIKAIKALSGEGIRVNVDADLLARRRRCLRPRRARRTSARSSGGSTTSRRTAWG